MEEKESLRFSNVIHMTLAYTIGDLGSVAILGFFVALILWIWLPSYSSGLYLYFIIVSIISFFYAYNEETTRVRLIQNKNEEKKYEEYVEQKRLGVQAKELIEQSNALSKSLNSLVLDAEKYLDLAQTEFAERAYAPFWDAIENSINCLGQFDETLNKISFNSKSFQQIVSQLQDGQPDFSVSVSNAPNPMITSERIRNIVRRAQRDFEFSTIYEQRKTNQILVAGFGNLANAINNMSSELQDSINDLSSSIEVSFENQNQILTNKLDEVHQSIDALKSSSERHEKQVDKEIEMLDNIQRRRKPNELIPDSRDGNWEKG